MVDWFGWSVGFNGISTSRGYLMPKSVYTYYMYSLLTLFDDTILKPNNSFTHIRVNIFKYFYMTLVYLVMIVVVFFIISHYYFY